MGRDHGGRGGNAAQRKRHKPVNSGSVGQQWPRFSGPPPSSQQNGYGEEKPVLLTGKFVELFTLIFNKLQMNIWLKVKPPFPYNITGNVNVRTVSLAKKSKTGNQF